MVRAHHGHELILNERGVTDGRISVLTKQQFWNDEEVHLARVRLERGMWDIHEMNRHLRRLPAELTNEFWRHRHHCIVGARNHEPA